MLFQKFAIAAALAALVAAQEIERDDIPQQCTQVCAQVVSIARDCDNRFDGNAEIQCICNAANASTLLPACDACVQQYDTDSDLDDDDNDDDVNDVNDVREVLNRCNFPVQSSSKSASDGSVVAAAVPTSSAATTATTANRIVVTSTSDANVASSAAAAASQVTQNVAPAMTAAAALGIGALGLALGML